MIFGHKLQQVDQRNDVVAVVKQGLLHALAHGLAGCKVDNAFNVGVLLEHSLRSGLVAKVYLLESRPDAGNLFNAIQDLNVGIGEVVDDDNLVTCLLQLYRGMGTDEAGSAGNENGLFHCICGIIDESATKLRKKLNTGKVPSHLNLIQTKQYFQATVDAGEAHESQRQQTCRDQNNGHALHALGDSDQFQLLANAGKDRQGKGKTQGR